MIEIRSALPKDLTQITQIIASYPEEIYQHHDYEYLMKIRHFSETCLVAEEDGDVLGFVVGYRGGPTNEIFFLWQVAVDRKAIGREIGFELIWKACENSKQLGCKFLECTITSAPSRHTLEKIAKQFGSSLLKIGVVEFRNPLSGSIDSEDLFKLEFHV